MRASELAARYWAYAADWTSSRRPIDRPERSLAGSMPRTLADDAKYWRARSEETRVVADAMRDPKCRAITARIANEYERLAVHAERRSKPAR